MTNIHIETDELYRLQLEFPTEFYAVLQNICSFSLDYLVKKINEAIVEANEAGQMKSSGRDNSYRDVFVKIEVLEMEFDPFIILFSTVRKNSVFSDGIRTITGKEIEQTFEILRDIVKSIGEKYPTTHNYSFAPEAYEAEKANFVEELSSVKRTLIELDDDFAKGYTRLLSTQ